MKSAILQSDSYVRGVLRGVFKRFHSPECYICMESKRKVKFNNCRHGCCIECREKLNKCPICRVHFAVAAPQSARIFSLNRQPALPGERIINIGRFMRDIEIVMSQAYVDRETAMSALIRNDYNPVDAIMELTTQAPVDGEVVIEPVTGRIFF